MTHEPLDFDTLVHLMRQMAHDMRGPLGSLTGTSDMLVGGTYGELSLKQERAAKRVQRNSYRLLTLLDDLMVYIKAEAGHLVLNNISFNPQQLLRDLHDELLPETRSRELTMHLSGVENLPEILVSDAVLIRRVVLALSWNALTYSTPGDVTLHTTWLADTSTWTIRVQDHGQGIKPENVAHIFEPLWRGEDRFQGPHKTSNFGMGLAIAQALSRLMGGQLALTMTGELGSVFEFSVPCKVDPEMAILHEGMS